MRTLFRQAVIWSRTLHIYLTMFAMLMLVFFSVTGIILDHEDFFAKADTPPTVINGEIPLEYIKADNKLLIVETLRSKYHAVGAMSTFDEDDSRIRIEFRGPGRRTEAEIEKATGKATVSLDIRGWVMRLDDLHRGKDSGRAWIWILDITAALLLAGSITGIMMWIALPRRRTYGVVALVASVVICFGVYFVLVP